MKTSFNLIILLSFFIAGCSNSGNKQDAEHKYFTGTIEYAYSYTSDLLNVDSLSAARQLKAFFRYDENDYQSRFINPDTTTYFYSGKLNKCLSETNSLRNYECEDYSAITDSIVSWKVYDTDEKVLGYACRVLEERKKNSLLIYYFSTEMKMAPVTYNRHHSYNWDFYGEKSEGGIILKSEIRVKDFSRKGIATNVTVQDKNFRALQIDREVFTAVCGNTN
jgi:hypothetical protein